jgi:hypothetical protein
MKSSHRRLLHWATAGTVLFLLSGCGNANDESKRPPPPPVKDTVFGDMVDAKERAKRDTEQAMELHKQQMEQAVKKNEE